MVVPKGKTDWRTYVVRQFIERGGTRGVTVAPLGKSRCVNKGAAAAGANSARLGTCFDATRVISGRLPELARRQHRRTMFATALTLPVRQEAAALAGFQSLLPSA